MQEESRGNGHRSSTGTSSIQERFASKQFMGGGYKRESVVVILDAAEEVLTLDGLEWALLNVVNPGRNELIILGILHETQDFSFLWGGLLKVTCCASRGAKAKQLNQKINQKLEAYHWALQQSEVLREKDGVKVHIRVTAGFSPLHSIAVQETTALAASWVVLDRTLKTHRRYFSEQMTCNVVLMKNKVEAEVLRIHQQQHDSGKSPMSMGDISLDSILLADTGFHTNDGLPTPARASPVSTRNSSGPRHSNMQNPAYQAFNGEPMLVLAPGLLADALSFRTVDPSFEVSWMDPGADDAGPHGPLTKTMERVDSDMDCSSASIPPTPRPSTLAQAVKKRFTTGPLRVADEPHDASTADLHSEYEEEVPDMAEGHDPTTPPPFKAAQGPAPTTPSPTVPRPATPSPDDGYASDLSSHSDFSSDFGGRTPRALSKLVQGQRQPGLESRTTSRFRTDRAPNAGFRAQSAVYDDDGDSDSSSFPASRVHATIVAAAMAHYQRRTHTKPNPNPNPRAPPSNPSSASFARSTSFPPSPLVPIHPPSFSNNSPKPRLVVGYPYQSQSPRSRAGSRLSGKLSPAVSLLSRQSSHLTSASPTSSTRSSRFYQSPNQWRQDPSRSTSQEREVHPKVPAPALLSPPRFEQFEF